MVATVTWHQCHSIVWRENELSGHFWPERTLIKRWDVVEPFGRRTFNSEKCAEKYAEEAEAFHKKYPWTPPRSVRELAYLASLAARGLQ